MSNYYVLIGDNPKNFRIFEFHGTLKDLSKKHDSFAVFNSIEEAARYCNLINENNFLHKRCNLAEKVAQEGWDKYYDMEDRFGKPSN